MPRRAGGRGTAPGTRSGTRRGPRNNEPDSPRPSEQPAGLTAALRACDAGRWAIRSWRAGRLLGEQRAVRHVAGLAGWQAGGKPARLTPKGSGVIYREALDARGVSLPGPSTPCAFAVGDRARSRGSRWGAGAVRGGGMCDRHQPRVVRAALGGTATTRRRHIIGSGTALAPPEPGYRRSEPRRTVLSRPKTTSGMRAMSGPEGLRPHARGHGKRVVRYDALGSASGGASAASRQRVVRSGRWPSSVGGPR